MHKYVFLLALFLFNITQLRMFINMLLYVLHSQWNRHKIIWPMTFFILSNIFMQKQDMNGYANIMHSYLRKNYNVIKVIQNLKQNNKYRPNVTSNMLDTTGLCCNATFYLYVWDKYVAMHFIFLLTKLNNDNMHLN